MIKILIDIVKLGQLNTLNCTNFSLALQGDYNNPSLSLFWDVTTNNDYIFATQLTFDDS